MNFTLPKRMMPAIIAFVLLLYFGLALFGKAIFGAGWAAPSDNLTQTLVNLTIASVMYFVGTTQSSASKDATIATLGGAPPSPPDSVSATSTKTITSTTSPQSPAPGAPPP